MYEIMRPYLYVFFKVKCIDEFLPSKQFFFPLIKEKLDNNMSICKISFREFSPPSFAIISLTSKMNLTIKISLAYLIFERKD